MSLMIQNLQRHWSSAPLERDTCSLEQLFLFPSTHRCRNTAEIRTDRPNWITGGLCFLPAVHKAEREKYPDFLPLVEWFPIRAETVLEQNRVETSLVASVDLHFSKCSSGIHFRVRIS